MAEFAEKIATKCATTLDKPLGKITAAELPSRLACEVFAGGLETRKAVGADVRNFVDDLGVDKKKALYTLSVAGFGVAAMVITKDPRKPALPQEVSTLVQHISQTRTLLPNDVIKATNMLRASTRVDAAVLQEELRTASSALEKFKPTGGASLWEPFKEQFSAIARRSGELVERRRALLETAKSLDQGPNKTSGTAPPWEAVEARLIQPLINTGKAAQRILLDLGLEVSSADKIKLVGGTVARSQSFSAKELGWVRSLTQLSQNN
jgi:hypothetical protein